MIILFIDKISLVKEFFKFFILFNRIKLVIKFSIAGDFNQLATIDDRIQKYIKYNFNNKNFIALNKLCNNNQLELSYGRRSDNVFINMCKFKNINIIDILFLN